MRKISAAETTNDGGSVARTIPSVSDGVHIRTTSIPTSQYAVGYSTIPAGYSTGAAGYSTGAAGYSTGAAGYTTGAAGYTTGAAGYSTGAAGYTTGAPGYTTYSSGMTGATTYGQVHGATTTVTRTGREQVLSERIVEHEITVPRRVVVEDVVEKTIVVPEKIRREEIIEERQVVRQKIVEIAQPVIQNRIVEVPQVEYRDQVVEVPEYRVQENIRQVPRYEVQENIQYINRVEYRNVDVEDVHIEYRDIINEQIVEVPEIHTETVIREVPITQFIDKPVANYVDVEIFEDVSRSIPVPIEATTTTTFAIPKLVARYQQVQVPIYVPKFVEVPFPEEALTVDSRAFCESMLSQIESVVGTGAPSLCTLEQLAKDSKDFVPALEEVQATWHQIWGRQFQNS